MEEIYLNLHLHSKKVPGIDANDYIEDVDKIVNKINEIKRKTIISFTNHDSFYKDQFIQINSKKLNKLVEILPGAELTFNDIKCHSLVITSKENIEYFDCFMKKWKEFENKKRKFSNFIEEWGKEKYGILIFHFFDKTDKISLDKLEEVVNSIKKENLPIEIGVECKEKLNKVAAENSLMEKSLRFIPVFGFYDDDLFKTRNSRKNHNITRFLGDNTFLSLFTWMRRAFLFEINDNEDWKLENSNKENLGELNLIIGERATGKSKLLNLFKEKYDKNETLIYEQGVGDDSLNKKKFIKKLKEENPILKSFLNLNNPKEWQSEIFSINKIKTNIISMLDNLSVLEGQKHFFKFKTHLKNKENDRRTNKYKILSPENNFLDEMIKNNRLTNEGYIEDRDTDSFIKKSLEETELISKSDIKLNQNKINKMINIKKRNDISKEKVKLKHMYKKIEYTKLIKKEMIETLKKYKYNEETYEDWILTYYKHYSNLNKNKEKLLSKMQEIKDKYEKIKNKEITSISERINGKWGIYRNYYEKKKKEKQHIIWKYYEDINSLIKEFNNEATKIEFEKSLEINSLPFGIEVEVKDTKGNIPSGSQRSSFFLISKLQQEISKEKKYLFLDEIDNALDSRAIKSSFQDLLFKLITEGNKHIYLVTHNITTCFLIPHKNIYLTKYKEELDAKIKIKIEDIPLDEWRICLSKREHRARLFDFFEENNLEWNRKRLIYGKNI